MFVDNYLTHPESFDLAGAPDMMGEIGFDPGYLRPFFDDEGVPSVVINTGEEYWDDKLQIYQPKKEIVRLRDMRLSGNRTSPVENATTLRYREWTMLEAAVNRVARKRLRAWSDLMAENPVRLSDGMSVMILEWENISDPGQAKVDMDGLTEGRTDTPLYQLEGLPLPITHGDFWYSERRLRVGRRKGTPLDVTMAEAVGRRVAETIEQTLIGTFTNVTYGTASDYNNTPTVYGYTNHPDRNTVTSLTAPSSSNGTTIVDDILGMIETARGDNQYGPYMLYVSTGYDRYLDNDLKANSDKTVRQRIREIEEIRDVRRLDYLSGNVMLLVQMDANTAQAIEGMRFTTVQWPSNGGMRINFKVMTIAVPRIRSDYNGQSGIVHGTTA